MLLVMWPSRGLRLDEAESSSCDDTNMMGRYPAYALTYAAANLC